MVPLQTVDKKTDASYVLPSKLTSNDKIALIRTDLAIKYGDSMADSLMKAYDKPIRKMLDNGFNKDVVASSIMTLKTEEQVIFDMLDLPEFDTGHIRQWLANRIDIQIDAEENAQGKHKDLRFSFKNSPDFDILSQIRMNPAGVKSLINAIHKDMGFFEKMFSGTSVRDVTDNAFDVLYGDQSGGYDPETDDISLATFVDKTKNEVLVFAGTVSSNKAGKMLQLFAAKKFFLVPKSIMAAKVAISMRDLAIKNVKADATLSDEDKKALLKNIEEDYKDLAKFVSEIILERNHDGKAQTAGGTKDPYNYLHGYEKTMLVQYLQYFELNNPQLRILENPDNSATIKGKNNDNAKNIMCMAGLATLSGEVGLASLLEEQGGRESDLYKVNIKDKDVMKAFLSTIVDDYGMQPGRWNNVPVYGPEGSLKAHIKWLRGDPKIVATEVEKVDKVKAEKDAAKEVAASSRLQPKPVDTK